MSDTSNVHAATTNRDPARRTNKVVTQDDEIAARLEESPEDPEAQLDAALDASMDGSDPISITQPARAAD